MKTLHAIDGSGRYLIETMPDQGDALTIRTIPDPLFGPKTKRKRRKRNNPKNKQT